MSSTKSAQVQQQPFGLPVPTPETLSLCEGLSGEQCMARASVLIEEYDYDGAMAVLQVAVVRSEGSVGSVEALTDFLVGVYGRYDDAVSLLESHELRRKLSPRLEQLLATSLYHLRRYDEALGYFENRAKQGQSSPEELQILGDTLLEVGRDKEALRYLRQAQKDRPGEPQLLKLIERAEAVVGKEEKKLVATARSAFKKGDLKQARQFAEEAAATGLLDPALTTLLRELREAEHTSAVDALRQRAVDAMEKGVFAEAMAAWRDLLTLDGENKEASEALGELQESSDRETFQAHMGRARDVLVTGDMLGTYKHLHHAYQVNGGDKWLALEEPAGLVELLLEYLDTHPKNPDKGFQGLVLLDQALLARITMIIGATACAGDPVVLPRLLASGTFFASR